MGRGANAPLVISHHKLSGQANHGRSTQTLAMMQTASLQQNICIDC
jgi:N-acyl-D-aspartate/D-glutamate deacylase